MELNINGCQQKISEKYLIVHDRIVQIYGPISSKLREFTDLQVMIKGGLRMEVNDHNQIT